MTVCRAQVRIKSATGDPANDAVNTFHFESESDVFPGTNFSNLNDLLQDLYEGLDQYMSSTLCGTEAQLKVYNLEDPLPRAPVYENTWTLAPTSGQPLPPELAICVSYQGALESGIPRARRRGRFYVPFLLANTVNNGFISVTTQTGIANWADGLMEAASAASSWDWVVYSPTIAGSSPGSAGSYSPVEKVWVDNDWDVQRRRGMKSTTRVERLVNVSDT